MQPTPRLFQPESGRAWGWGRPSSRIVPPGQAGARECAPEETPRPLRAWGLVLRTAGGLLSRGDA